MAIQVRPATSDPASGSEIAKHILLCPSSTSFVTFYEIFFYAKFITGGRPIAIPDFNESTNPD